MSAGKTTARVYREQEQARLSRALRHRMEKRGVTIVALAAACGVSKSLVRRWLDAEDPCQAGAHDVACFPAALRLDFGQDMLGDTLTVCEALDTAEGQPGIGLLASALKELGEFQRAYADGLADGHFTGPELGEVICEGEEAIQVARAIVEWARQESERRTGRALKAVSQ